MINYKHLHYFWTAAKQGGIARASERLHITPQTISGQIGLLEEQLGEALFVVSLEINDETQREMALRSLATRLAKAVVDGDYPPGSRRGRDVNRLCDRTSFLRLAAEEAHDLAPDAGPLTLQALAEALVMGDSRVRGTVS